MNGNDKGSKQVREHSSDPWGAYKRHKVSIGIAGVLFLALFVAAVLISIGIGYGSESSFATRGWFAVPIIAMALLVLGLLAFERGARDGTNADRVLVVILWAGIVAWWNGAVKLRSGIIEWWCKRTWEGRVADIALLLLFVTLATLVILLTASNLNTEAGISDPGVAAILGLTTVLVVMTGLWLIAGSGSGRRVLRGTVTVVWLLGSRWWYGLIWDYVDLLISGGLKGVAIILVLLFTIAVMLLTALSVGLLVRAILGKRPVLKDGDEVELADKPEGKPVRYQPIAKRKNGEYVVGLLPVERGQMDKEDKNGIAAEVTVPGMEGDAMNGNENRGEQWQEQPKPKQERDCRDRFVSIGVPIFFLLFAASMGLVVAGEPDIDAGWARFGIIASVFLAIVLIALGSALLFALFRREREVGKDGELQRVVMANDGRIRTFWRIFGIVVVVPVVLVASYIARVFAPLTELDDITTAAVAVFAMLLFLLPARWLEAKVKGASSKPPFRVKEFDEGDEVTELTDDAVGAVLKDEECEIAVGAKRWNGEYELVVVAVKPKSAGGENRVEGERE